MKNILKYMAVLALALSCVLGACASKPKQDSETSSTKEASSSTQEASAAQSSAVTSKAQNLSEKSAEDLSKMMQFISCRVIDVETIVYRREDFPSVSQTHIVQVVAAVGDVAALNAQFFRSCDEGGLVSIIVSFWK